MRVCLISREYPPDTGYGGIATFTRHLAHGLKEIGNEVVVVSLAEGAPKVQDDDGITVHRVAQLVIPNDLGAVAMCMPYSRYVLKTSSALWQKFFQLHEEKPFDVVDTPELLAEGLYPAVTKAVPLVIRLYTPHSKFIAEQLHNVSANFDHQFVASLERVAMLNADAITSPSNDLADFVADDLSYQRDRIRLIYNPIDPAIFTPDGPKALPQPQGKRVLFVGRLEERKGITYLVQAIPQILETCPDTEFVIIGADTNNAAGGQRSVKADLCDYLKRCGVLDKVQFIPRIPLNELPQYYRSADVCVVPSVYDNSPYTSLEAMACGRPVVGTSGGGTKEYVTHNECGLIVAPRDTEALKDAIVELLQDDAKRDRFAVNARARVLAKFQRTQIARETVELYAQAKVDFLAKQRSLYLKDPSHALSDASVLMFTFDKMIYDLLYQRSLRFRMKHWTTLLAQRPRLLAAKVLLRVIRTVSRAAGHRSSTPKIVQWLEQQVVVRQKDPFTELLQGQSNKKS